MNLARLSSLRTLLCLLLAWSNLAIADTTDVKVNGDGSLTEQRNARLAVVPDGTFAVVWLDYRNGNGDIYLQRLSKLGEPLSFDRKINTDTLGSHQTAPSIASDKRGQYSAVWLDYRGSTYPLDPEVYLQKLDSSAAPSGGNRNLTPSTPDSLKALPDIALSPTGAGVVVWEDYRNKNWDVWAQRVSASGAPLGAQFRVNDDVGTSQQHAPRAAYSSDGWFVVVWYDNRWGDDDIFVQRFDSTGNRMGANIRVSAAATGSRQAFPDVAADDAGHFTVVWVDWRNGTYPANPDIYARRYDTLLVPEAERRVNTDGSARPQTSPSIAADRMGNVAIVWADSGTTSWDVVGQMVDATGIIRESNFRAHTLRDSAQLQPDVAIDGRNRYICWTDKRNGHFDIYASIKQYNDPHLVASPASVQFTMPVNGALPPAQSVIVQQAGYNPLNYQVISLADWLTVTPTGGITPDTLSFAVITDTLAAGLYSTTVTLIDTANNDSSCVVQVRLEIQSPLIAVADDTVAIQAFAGIAYPMQDSIQITNAGTGTLNWAVAETASWLTLSPASGTQGESFEFTVSAESLAVGTHMAPIEITSAEATNSPETVWIAVEAIDSQSYLAAIPDTVTAQIVAESLHTYTAVVTNLGAGEINWSASTAEPWLSVQTLFGVGGDTLVFTVDPSLLAIGTSSGSIVLIDSGSFNVSFSVAVIIDYAPPPDASIQVGSDQTVFGQAAVVPVGLSVNEPIESLLVVISFDSTALAFDSMHFDAGLPDSADPSVLGCVADGRIAFQFGDGQFAAGAHALGVLYFTPLVETALCSLDSTNCDGSVLSARLVSGGPARVGIEAGEVLISPATDVDEDEDLHLPAEYALHGNYPNPFNLNTVISFDLPAQSNVTLDIFNLLGQQIIRLVNGPRAAGRHLVEWDGRADNGGVASTGIYFCRFEAAGRVMVRKMVLLK